LTTARRSGAHGCTAAVRQLHTATGDVRLLVPVVRSMRGAEIKALLPSLLSALTGAAAC
jgi:hypothetical protein